MIVTPRLELRPATVAQLRAELAGAPDFLGLPGVVVPADWPPELYDADAVRYNLAWLAAHPDQSAWGFHYVVRRASGAHPPVLIGACGFKGPPDSEGVVEIGYGIVAGHQRQGYATEAVGGLVQQALATPAVTAVIGQTLPSLTASIGVLLKAGFVQAGSGHDPHAPASEPVIRFERRRLAREAR